MNQRDEWNGFQGRLWREEVNTRDFIQCNYTPYDGDESFLEKPTEATNKLWEILQNLQKEERKKGGVLDMDTDVVSTLISHRPGYISEEHKDLEQVVGLQTDKPLKRAFMPLAALRWLNNHAKLMAINPHQSFIKFLLNITERTIKLCLMLIPQR